jgi:hypothetical protein
MLMFFLLDEVTFELSLVLILVELAVVEIC